MTNKHHHRHKYSFGQFIHDIGPATRTIGHIIEDGIKQGGHIIVTGEKQLGSVSNNLVKSSTGILNKISMPLIIVGGVVAFFVLTKK